MNGTAVRTAPPRSLIVTIYGLYAREAGGWLSVAALIRLLESLGVDEPAVRSSISRLKRRGIVLAEKRDGAAGYGLSERAREILAKGDRRIFNRRRAMSDDGWVLAVFSVPEAERARRHTLRSRLSGLGFGNVAPGVWIAPVHLAEETHAVLSRLDLGRYVDLFTARAVDAVNLPGDIARWWDLERIRAAHSGYVRAWQPVAAAWQRRRRVDPEPAFVDYVQTLSAWRRLPYLDPGLPAALLPPDWPAGEAAEVFFALHDRLGASAHEFVEGVR